MKLKIVMFGLKNVMNLEHHLHRNFSINIQYSFAKVGKLKATINTKVREN